MDKSYDLNLGNWGPYNKEYAGVLNIADKKLGTTFNVEMFPGFFRRSVMASTLLVDGGVKPWKCNPSRTNFTYRYELEWKDKIYVDVNYNVSNDKRVDIKCDFVNQTDIPQSLSINLCASLQPLKEKLGPVFLKYKPTIKPVLVGDTKYIFALDYIDIKTSSSMATSGYYLGEGLCENTSSFSKTALVGTHFNSKKHFVKYDIGGYAVSSLGVRYKAEKPCNLTVLVDSTPYVLPLEKCDDFNYFGIEIDKTTANTITLIPSDAVTIDSVCYGENAKHVEYKTLPLDLSAEREVCGVAPEVTELPVKSGKEGYLKLYYKSVNKTYIIKWDYPVSLIRRFYCDDIGQMLCYRAQDHVNHWWRGVGDGVYDNVLSDAIFLNAGETKTITFTVFEDDDTTPYVDNSAEKPVKTDKYAFSQNLTSATLYLNTVYPIYSRRSFIRHNTPGRFWDCLYTWDSGLIGVGLATVDFDSAFDNLKAYLTPYGDKHAKFVFAGSSVPTQILLYKYLFDKYPDRRLELKEIYPMVKQIFYFYKNLEKECGLKSGLANAWKYCYNSGGWDDYPPQKHLISSSRLGGEANYKNTTPVITSAFTVLIAKILREIALIFGFENEYDGFISKTSSAIENLLWNEETGYYSYLIHDETGNPKKPLTYNDGSDYNMGFDGVYPMVAGISGKDRVNRIIENIKNGLMTEYGLSVVDKRASYYLNSGYWNGSVWVPHGWILWNALLDQGDCELADTLAKSYLDKWADEVDKTYSSFEHFMLANGRGAGYHNFSGLSSPILDFYASYFNENAVSCGFETLIISKTENEIKYKTEKDGAYLLIRTSSDNFTVNGKKVKSISAFSGAKYVPIEKGSGVVNF